MTWTSWLPDFKGALKGFYEENVKETVEKTQKALIAIALGIFLLLAIAYFWP